MQAGYPGDGADRGALAQKVQGHKGLVLVYTHVPEQVLALLGVGLLAPRTAVAAGPVPVESVLAAVAVAVLAAHRVFPSHAAGAARMALRNRAAPAVRILARRQLALPAGRFLSCSCSLTVRTVYPQ